MNRDGYADLLVGSEGDASGTGSVTVLWGGAAPFRSASRCPRDRRIPAACSAPTSAGAGRGDRGCGSVRAWPTPVEAQARGRPFGCGWPGGG
ncbi:hypothetical protein ACIP4Y_36595 [Streptomyces sp. NPDC088810]|uniref:hypothetical protein n=1 Tax=Streptomyces sp. NPDC088810 TaxID=3365904 RepID=UPI00380E231C